MNSATSFSSSASSALSAISAALPKLFPACLLPLLLSAFALSCSSPELLRRYASATQHTASAPDQHAQLSAFVLADAVDANNLNVAASASERTPSVIPSNGPRFRKRIVLSIERAESLAPADRLDRVTVSLAVSATANFLSWDKFTTEYDTVDLGKLSSDTTRAFDAGLNAGPTSSARGPANGQLGFKSSRTLSEDVVVRSRYVAFTGTLSDHEARIHEEGVAGIDLAGNATLDLVIEATPAAEPQTVLQLGPLRDKNGWTKDQAAITAERAFIPYAAHAAPIVAQLSGRYVVRHVTRHAETFSEGDDTVESIRGNFRGQPLTLVTAAELALRVWAIQTPAHDLLYLQPLGVVEFASHQEADAFLGWLRATGNTAIGGYPLKLGGDTGPNLDPAKIPDLKIYVRQVN